jgi:hypothetical protein
MRIFHQSIPMAGIDTGRSRDYRQCSLRLKEQTRKIRENSGDRRRWP